MPTLKPFTPPERSRLPAEGISSLCGCLPEGKHRITPPSQGTWQRPVEIGFIMFSTVIIAYITIAIPNLWTLENVLIFIFAVIGGACIFSSITIFSCAISFWTYDSQFFYRLIKQGTKQMLWYPLEFYNKMIRFVLTFVYPLAFISYYPSMRIFNKNMGIVPAAFGYCSIIIGTFLISLAVALWQYSLKRYEGAGG